MVSTCFFSACARSRSLRVQACKGVSPAPAFLGGDASMPPGSLGQALPRLLPAAEASGLSPEFHSARPFPPTGPLGLGDQPAYQEQPFLPANEMLTPTEILVKKLDSSTATPGGLTVHGVGHRLRAPLSSQRPGPGVCSGAWCCPRGGLGHLWSTCVPGSWGSLGWKRVPALLLVLMTDQCPATGLWAIWCTGLVTQALQGGRPAGGK